jgi:hypothetical protein
MSVIPGDADSVIVAETDCPGVSEVPARFQLIVIGPFALAGLQLLVDILRSSVTPVPVFLT